MCFVCAQQPTTASATAAYALQQFGWKKNTTYTVIKRLVEKKMLRRDEPGFFIVPLVQKEQVQQAQAAALLEKRFDNNVALLRNALKQAGVSL